MRRIIQVTALILIGMVLMSFPCQPVDAIEEMASSASNVQLTDVLKEVCNSVMIAIYNDILSMKQDYVNLEDFGEHVLTRNQRGIYRIEYQHTILDGMRKGEFLAFGATIVKSEDTNFNEHGQQAFNFDFPLMGIKFSGYQKTSRKFMKFSIQEIVQKNGDPLLLEQQKHLPLRLTLKPNQDSYKIGENMKISVILENVSRKNLWIKDLNGETLYFLYNDVKWGAVEVSASEKKRRRKFILEPGQKIRKKFIGSGSSVVRTIEVYCSYAMAFKGVRPASVLTVEVTE